MPFALGFTAFPTLEVPFASVFKFRVWGLRFQTCRGRTSASHYGNQLSNAVQRGQTTQTYSFQGVGLSTLNPNLCAFPTQPRRPKAHQRPPKCPGRPPKNALPNPKKQRPTEALSVEQQPQTKDQPEALPKPRNP